MRKDGYRNGVLTAIALLLGVMVLGGGSGPEAAHAGGVELDSNQSGRAQVIGGSAHRSSQPGYHQTIDRPEGGGLISAADQRKMILKEMRALREEMARTRAMLAKGLSVKVTEMPELRLPREMRESNPGEG